MNTRWWWIRHAPVISHKGVIYGSLDVDCDTSDAEAFSALARMLPKGAVWVASGLKRTHQTAAAIVAQGLEAPEPIFEPDLDEQSFGDWHGMRWTDFHQGDDAVADAFWKDPANNPPPGGESFAHVIERASAAIDRLTEAHQGRDIIAVAHGGTIRAALAHALGLDANAAMAFILDNASLTRIDHVPKGIVRAIEGYWRVEGVNIPPR